MLRLFMLLMLLTGITVGVAQAVQAGELRLVQGGSVLSTAGLQAETSINVDTLLCASLLNPEPVVSSFGASAGQLEAQTRQLELLHGVDCSGYSWPVYQYLSPQGSQPCAIAPGRELPCLRYTLHLDFDRAQVSHARAVDIFREQFDVHLWVQAERPSSDLDQDMVRPEIEVSFDGQRWQTLQMQETLIVPGQAFAFHAFEAPEREACPAEYQDCQRIMLDASLYYRMRITGEEGQMRYRFRTIIGSDSVVNEP